MPLAELSPGTTLRLAAGQAYRDITITPVDNTLVQLLTGRPQLLLPLRVRVR